MQWVIREEKRKNSHPTFSVRNFIGKSLYLHHWLSLFLLMLAFPYFYLASFMPAFRFGKWSKACSCQASRQKVKWMNWRCFRQINKHTASHRQWITGWKKCKNSPQTCVEYKRSNSYSPSLSTSTESLYRGTGRWCTHIHTSNPLGNSVFLAFAIVICQIRSCSALVKFSNSQNGCKTEKKRRKSEVEK